MAPPVEKDINCSTFDLVEFKKRFRDPLRFTSLSKTGFLEDTDTLDCAAKCKIIFGSISLINSPTCLDLISMFS